MLVTFSKRLQHLYICFQVLNKSYHMFTGCVSLCMSKHERMYYSKYGNNCKVKYVGVRLSFSLFH